MIPVSDETVYNLNYCFVLFLFLNIVIWVPYQPISKFHFWMLSPISVTTFFTFFPVFEVQRSFLQINDHIAFEFSDQSLHPSHLVFRYSITTMFTYFFLAGYNHAWIPLILLTFAFSIKLNAVRKDMTIGLYKN